MIYEPRTYRKPYHGDKKQVEICVGDTDLYIICDTCDETAVVRQIRRLRSTIMKEITVNPNFLQSLQPIGSLTDSQIVTTMCKAAEKAGVGPMASVAGVIAEAVGNELLKSCKTAIVENGGDLFIGSDQDVTVRVSCPNSILDNKVGIMLLSEQLPVGLCTSSGTTGHSLSFGKADAVTVMSQDTALADAVATATANRVQTGEDIEAALAYGMSIHGVLGILIIVKDQIGVSGQIKLIRL